MKQLKIFMFILLAITIFSCYSNEPDCYNDGDIIWEPAGSLPYSGYRWEIAVASDGNIWAYSNQLELYLSTNNGDTWAKKGNIPFTGHWLGVSPKNGYLFVTDIYYGLHRSTDNGANWEYIVDDSLVFSQILFTASGEMYVGVHNHGREEKTIIYSNDNGNTWENKSSGLPKLIIVYSLALGQDGTLYAISSESVYRSTNRGNSWYQFSNHTHGYISSLTICDDGSIFATAQPVEDHAIILKSTYEGLNWNEINIDGLVYTSTSRIVYNPITNDIFVILCIGGGFYNLGTPTYFKVYRSSNLGENWKLTNTGYPNKHGDLAVNPKTGQMFIGTRTGVYRTKNYPK
jgi:photosystem II stability/assembly factor-like uncharacterized protein